MNHAAIIEHEAARPYTQRTTLYSDLDQRHFDALNPGGQIIVLWGYNLDALSEIPAGSMRQCGRLPAQHFVIRGRSLAEQQKLEALAERLVAEILAEELTAGSTT